MNVTLKPEYQKFVDDQVRTGRFGSAAEALEAGVARLMLDPRPTVLDPQEQADIRVSLQEMRQGEVVEWRAFSAELRKKYFDSKD